MTTTRRDFLRITACAGGALMIGFEWKAAENEKPFRPNAWILVEPDGTIVLTVGKTEMGQGVRTALPMILAEELEAEWSKIRIVQAAPSPDFKRLGTGGSFSIAGQWTPLRTAGAAAREMLVAAAAAKWSVTPESCVARDGAVAHPPSGRRASYGELAAAAAKLPVPAQPRLKSAKDFRIIGQRMKRIDGPHIVNGTATYGIDVRVPNMRFASIARGSVKRWKPVEHAFEISTGVAAIAGNTWAALKAREALEIEFEAPPPFDSVANEARLEQAARAGGTVTRKTGDGAAAIDRAATRLEAVYHYPFYAHAPLEPMNCVADVRAGSCEIWAPTQAPNAVQDAVAKLLRLDPSRVTVHVTLVGGGFGRRLGVDYALEAAELSKKAGVPVQVLWTRADDMRHGYFQGASAHYLRAGIDQGRLVAWTHTKAGSPHNARGAPPTAEELKKPAVCQDLSWGVYDVPYAIPSIETAYAPVSIPVKHGPWRAVFSPGSTFARESFLDEVAHALQKDPIALRLDLLAGDDLLHAGDGDAMLTIDRRRLRRVIALAAEKSGWGRRSGLGFACNVYDGATHIAYVVEMSGPRVKRVVAAVDCGQVINPTGVEQQIEGGVIWALSQALKGSITFKGGTAEQTSFVDYDVARIADTPTIEVHIVKNENAPPSGMGEPPVPPLAPAIANAIFATTGRRIRRLPLA